MDIPLSVLQHVTISVRVIMFYRSISKMYRHLPIKLRLLEWKWGQTASKNLYYRPVI